jgi:hypothetical protein
MVDVRPRRIRVSIIAGLAESIMRESFSASFRPVDLLIAWADALSDHVRMDCDALGFHLPDLALARDRSGAQRDLQSCHA